MFTFSLLYHSNIYEVLASRNHQSHLQKLKEIPQLDCHFVRIMKWKPHKFARPNQCQEPLDIYGESKESNLKTVLSGYNFFDETWSLSEEIIHCLVLIKQK